MLRWAVIFLVIALVAAVFGFTGIAVAAAGIAKFLFFIFLVACLFLHYRHDGRQKNAITQDRFGRNHVGVRTSQWSHAVLRVLRQNSLM